MLARPSDHDVLLVVDVQNDFLPGGALAVPDGDAVVSLANTLAQRFAHVVLTQDWHVPGHLSFASSHPGQAPFETITLFYGPQILWRGGRRDAHGPRRLFARARLRPGLFRGSCHR